MVWFRYREKKSGLLRRHTTHEFLKKFQRDGTPDGAYFGGGMYANYLYEPADLQMGSCEIHPELAKDRVQLSHLVTGAPRSLELYKPHGKDSVMLVIRSTADDIDGYAKSLNVDCQRIGDLPDISGESVHEQKQFFDFELAHQLNFTSLEPGQEPVMDNLVRAMSSIRECGVMIQFAFTRSLEWNKTAETASANLSRYLRSSEQSKTGSAISGLDRHLLPRISARDVPRIKDLSSSAYNIGKRIEKSYHQKTVSILLTLSIRGVAVGTRENVRNMLQNLESVFATVSFLGDSLCRFDYTIEHERAHSWMKNNAMASQYAAEILQGNCDMWSDMRWGRGRDYVPFLCLTSDEFSVFVSLPSDPSLPVSYRRGRLRGISPEKQVFRLGTAI